MLTDLIFSINAVMPIFLVMLLGLVIRRFGLISAPSASQLNTVLFKVALPIKLFTDVYGSDYSQMFDLGFIAFTIGSILVFFFVCLAVAEKLIHDKKKKGAFIQGSFRGNYVILGVSLIPAILGYTPALAATCVIIIVPLFNILSVIALTVYGDRKLESKNTLVSIFQSIVTNPLIIGIFSGIIFSLIPVSMPQIMGSSINMVGASATPLALIVIGANLDFSSLRGRLNLVLTASALKLFVMPLIFLPLAFWFGISPEGIIVLFVLYCAPTAIVSYMMAASMGSDEHLASNIILVTSATSILTYTAGVYIMRTIGIV